MNAKNIVRRSSKVSRATATASASRKPSPSKQAKPTIKKVRGTDLAPPSSPPAAPL